MQQIIPGPPFAFGAVLVLMAIVVSFFIPENPKVNLSLPTTGSRKPDSPKSATFAGTRYRRASPNSQMRDHASDSVSDDSGDMMAISSGEYHRTPIKSDAIHHDVEGLWSRLMASLPDFRITGGSKRSHRRFRQPTVRFTRAGLVGPLRKLWTGLSHSHGTGPEYTSHLVHSGTDFTVPFPRFNSGSTTEYTPMLSNPLSMSRSETEDADLSNYRSHHLQRLLSSASRNDAKSPHKHDEVTVDDIGVLEDRQHLLQNEFTGDSGDLDVNDSQRLRLPIS